MAAVIQPLMQGGTAPWVLYFCGAVLALVLTGIGIPALPFALGMFLPLQLNLPLLIGGLIAWFVSTRSKDQALNKARMSQGTLIASGFIAGAPDGRSGSDPEIRRRGLETHAVEQFERSLVGRSGHVSGAYHLFRRTFAPR